MSFFPRRPRDASSHRQRGSSDSPDSLVCAAAADGEKPEVEEEEEDGAAVEATGRCLWRAGVKRRLLLCFPSAPGVCSSVWTARKLLFGLEEIQTEKVDSLQNPEHTLTHLLFIMCVSTDSSSSNQTLFTFYTFYSSVHSSVTFQSMLLCLSVVLRVFSFHTCVSRRQATSLKKICKLTGRFLSCDPEHILCTLITCCFIHEPSLCWCIDRLTGCSTFVHIHRQTSNVQPSGPRRRFSMWVVTFTELPAASLCSVRFISRPFSRTATFPLSVHLNHSKQEKEKCEDLS